MNLHAVWDARELVAMHRLVGAAHGKMDLARHLKRPAGSGTLSGSSHAGVPMGCLTPRALDRKDDRRNPKYSAWW